MANEPDNQKQPSEQNNTAKAVTQTTDNSTDSNIEPTVKTEAEEKEKTVVKKDKAKPKAKKSGLVTIIAPQDVKPGMNVRIFQKIKEIGKKKEMKERLQFFEGIVLARRHGREDGATITVRKISDGVGVEKIFPLNLPTLAKIELLRVARVRRAKLNFLRTPRKKKLKEKK